MFLAIGMGAGVQRNSFERVSTEEQAKEGVSLENQEEQIKRYCEYRGFDLVGILRDEGVSGGKVKNREGFVKIREKIEANGLEALIVYSIDRLSRDLGTLVIFEQLLDKYDVELHTIEGQIDTSSASGWMSGIDLVIGRRGAERWSCSALVRYCLYLSAVNPGRKFSIAQT